jgi:GTP-binding protein HflX
MKPELETISREKALLVQVVLGRRRTDEAEESLAELERLAHTAGVKVMGRTTQKRQRPTPGFFIGEGKLAELQLACRQTEANLIIFDNELSAVQVNNLDLSLGIKVIDRTELILQIFARRARSAESQVQVELAQLEYLVSRIPVSKRQQRFQGGIGMRGPGESPLQLRNAPMRRRIKDLKRKLAGIQQRRKRTRSRRAWPLVCLVGYTNAGKSTLLNAFTEADAYVDDRLFATLDTKTRLVVLEKGKSALLTDTVGFIRQLPHGLIASFRSTLEVAAEADLLLLVADAGHSHVHDHLAVARRTLEEIGAHEVATLVVFNKCDRKAAADALPGLKRSFPDALAISARKGTGIPALRREIRRRIPRWAGDRASPTQKDKSENSPVGA